MLRKAVAETKTEFEAQCTVFRVSNHQARSEGDKKLYENWAQDQGSQYQRQFPKQLHPNRRCARPAVNRVPRYQPETCSWPSFFHLLSVAAAVMSDRP